MILDDPMLNYWPKDTFLLFYKITLYAFYTKGIYNIHTTLHVIDIKYKTMKATLERNVTKC